MVIARKVELSFRSALAEELTVDDSPADGAASDVGAFRIRYESFDPDSCDGPARPADGFVSVSGLGLGQEVSYGCDPPYDVIGPDRAVCRVKDRTESPVPEWSFGPPKCQVTNCSSTVHRLVGHGALVSPGFPLYVVPGALDCRWVLRAVDRGARIGLTLTFLQLSLESESFGTLTISDDEGRQLASYGNTSDTPLDLATNASQVVVTLTTNNNQTVKGGFYLEYRLLEADCEDPASPHFGQVLFTSLSAGSWASYRCLPGYALAGDSRTLCQSNGTWIPDAPTCLPDPDLSSGDLSDPDLLLQTSSSQEPKLTKPTRKPKPKAKAAGKTHKVATKSKPSDLSKSLEQGSSEVDDSGSGNGDVDIPTDEQKQDGKQPFAINSAQDKSPKTKGNTTSMKHRTSPDVVQRTLDSSGALSGPDREEEESKLLDVLEEEAREEEVLGLKTYVVIGVTTALLLVVAALLVALVVYRKRFPVRMGFGRRFSTFENPIYASKDAQHTRELKRLTV